MDFLDRYEMYKLENELRKALSHKYIRRYPKKNGKGYNYVYADSWKHPFKALLECFGIGKEKIVADFDKENVSKDYDCDKQTFAAHILEYFTHKAKWDSLFSKKVVRDKAKKPVKNTSENKVKSTGTAKKTGAKKKAESDKFKPNLSLMRKVWTLYNPTGKSIAAQEAKTDNVSGGVNNGKDSTDTRRTVLPRNPKTIRSGGSEKTGNSDVSNNGNGDNGKQSSFGVVQSGVGFGNAIPDVDRGRGRVTKVTARKIREQCRKILEKSDSEITEADKAILAQYMGAGGIDEEGSSNSGVLYEFYTPRNVISKVWELVDKYNPRQDKSVIEPSSGIGRFAEGRSEKFTMFELEKDSARIAHLLHPNAEVVQGAFQENFMKQTKGRFTKNFEQFDVAVGNPPYGAYTGKYKGMGEGKEFKRYESYFMARTLDTVKDGGIMAMVVPSGFLNGGSSYGKDLEKIAEKAELLEAWRLPNGTFESTDVGTDIVVFRKGKGTTADALRNYFKNNPDHIAGEVSTRIGRFGEETYIKPKDGEDFASAVAAIDVGKVEASKEAEKAAKKVEVTEIKAEPKKISSKTKFGDTVKLDNGKVGRVSGYITKNRKTVGVRVNVDGKTEDVAFTDEQQAKRNRSEAMKGNDNAKGAHDYPSNPDGHIMDSDEFNKKYGKHFDAKDIAIWRVVDKFGNVDMSKLTDEQKEYVKTSDHYVKDGETYTNVVNYASGDIRKKLRELDENDPQYEQKKKLLEAVCPKEKGLLRTWKEVETRTNDKGEQIEVEVEKSEGFEISPLSDWTREYKLKDGSDLIEQGFIKWLAPGSENCPVAQSEIPVGINIYDIIEYARKVPYKTSKRELGIDKDDKKGFEHAKEKNKLNRRETAEKLFQRYLREGLTVEDQKDLVQAYNDKFNSFVNPDYTKIPVFVDGMSSHFHGKEFTLTDQQVKGITQLTNKGSGLLAYDVGVGKTITGIAATVNQIQTGRAKRPLICVPKAVYTNWIAEIHEHFPDVKINELGNLSKNYWKQGTSKIEDGTISICTYEGLKNIGFNGDEEAQLNEDVEFGALSSAADDSKKSKRQKAAKSEKAGEVVGGMLTTRDGGVQFSELGFDHITVDEVHNFRNLFKMPRHINKSKDDDTDEKNVSNEFDGVGQGGEPSALAMKLFAVTQLIQRKSEGRNTFLLSATPFQNSPTEIYSILSYMARDKLKEMNLYSLEEFIAKYCKVTREYAVSANTVKEKSVVKGFKDLSELQGLLTQYMDKVDGEEAGCIRPYKRMHAPELELTDVQKQIMENVSDYIDTQSQLPASLPPDKDGETQDKGYMFKAMNAMKLCALSPNLVSEEFLNFVDKKELTTDRFVENSPKLKFVCDSIIAQYKQNATHGQIMYMPLGVENHPQVKNYLIKHGIPKDAIEIMPKGSTESLQDKRDEITKNFNDVNGKIKVIIGGQDIKEGVNLNGNTTSIYCTQLDWNPTDVQQLWGRGWRQGNKQGIVHCITPLMHDSLDPMIYQKHDEKSSRTDDLYSYKGDTMNAQDVDPERLKFALIKDPKKRADMQVRDFREKNSDNQKMYEQMIDVLHNQIDFAYKDEAKFDEEAKRGLSWQFKSVEDSEKTISEYSDSLKKVKKFIEMFEKKFKNNLDEEIEVPKELDSLKFLYLYQDHISVKSLISELNDCANSYASNIDSNKSYIKTYKKNLKKLQGKQEACRKYLEQNGMKSKADCEQRIKDYVSLVDKCRQNVENAEKMRDKFFQEAVEDNKKNEKNLLSVDELVKLNVDEIMGDLHEMTDEFKAKIKAENDKRFNRDTVKKSWCWIDKNGKFRMTKSALATWHKYFKS